MQRKKSSFWADEHAVLGYVLAIILGAALLTSAIVIGGLQPPSESGEQSVKTTVDPVKASIQQGLQTSNNIIINDEATAKSTVEHRNAVEWKDLHTVGRNNIGSLFDAIKSRESVSGRVTDVEPAGSQGVTAGAFVQQFNDGSTTVQTPHIHPNTDLHVHEDAIRHEHPDTRKVTKYHHQHKDTKIATQHVNSCTESTTVTCTSHTHEEETLKYHHQHKNGYNHVGNCNTARSDCSGHWHANEIKHTHTKTIKVRERHKDWHHVKTTSYSHEHFEKNHCHLYGPGMGGNLGSYCLSNHKHYSTHIHEATTHDHWHYEYHYHDKEFTYEEWHDKYTYHETQFTTHHHDDIKNFGNNALQVHKHTERVTKTHKNTWTTTTDHHSSSCGGCDSHQHTESYMRVEYHDQDHWHDSTHMHTSTVSGSDFTHNGDKDWTVAQDVSETRDTYLVLNRGGLNNSDVNAFKLSTSNGWWLQAYNINDGNTMKIETSDGVTWTQTTNTATIDLSNGTINGVDHDVYLGGVQTATTPYDVSIQNGHNAYGGWKYVSDGTLAVDDTDTPEKVLADGIIYRARLDVTFESHDTLVTETISIEPEAEAEP